MKRIAIIFAVVLTVGLITSCQKDFLKLEPLSDYSTRMIWHKSLNPWWERPAGTSDAMRR